MNVTLTGMPNAITATVTQNNINVIFGTGMPGPSFSILGWLASLERCTDDQDAVNNFGLSVNDWYVLSSGTDIGLSGTLKQVL